MCFVLIARSVVKGGQSSCRGGDRSGARLGSARLGLDGQQVAFFSPEKWSVRMRAAIQEYRKPRVFSCQCAQKSSSRLGMRHESLHKEMRSNDISFLAQYSFFLLYDLLSGIIQPCIKLNPQLCVGGEMKSGRFTFLQFSLSCRHLRRPKCTNREGKKSASSATPCRSA